MYVFDAACFWRSFRGTKHPGSPLLVAFGLITLPARWHEVLDFRDIPGWLLVFHKWAEVVPFRSNAATVCALKSVGGHFEYCSACCTSSTLGFTTGIIELMKAFVMLELRPVIFIWVGNLNSVM